MVLFYGTSLFFLQTALRILCCGGLTTIQAPPLVPPPEVFPSESFLEIIALYFPGALQGSSRTISLQIDITSAGNDYPSFRS